MDTSDRILVTGAAGFMGSWICKALIEKGYSQLYGIDDLSGGNIKNIDTYINSGDLHFYINDLSNTMITNDLIMDIKPNIIFHLAANAREGASFFQPLDIVKRNILAYMNTLEAAIKGKRLNKIILFSSMAVYGNWTAPFYETMDRRPIDIYGINKSAMEHCTEILSNVHDFKYAILRPHNVFGPFQCLCDPYRNVIGIWMNKIMRQDPIYIFGDGRQKRAFSYIEDSLPCYLRAMGDKCDGEIINIGGSLPITINMLAELVKKYMEVPNYSIEYLPERFGEVKNAWCTVDKSKKLLGYEEKIGFEKGIENMAKWAKNTGSQPWKHDKLSLFNNMAPEIWT